MVLKGCVTGLVLLAALFGGYFWFLQHIPFPGNLVLSAFGAIGVLMLCSSLYQAVFGDGNANTYRRALNGEPLREGQVEAVWGPITPVGEPLRAPFSGQECVAYEYDAKRPEIAQEDGESRTQGSDISGFALTPSVIRSSRGDVRLQGFGMLTNFPEQDLSSFPLLQEQASAYLQATQFDEMGPTRIVKMLSQLDEMIADDDGAVRKDWLMRSKEQVQLASDRLSEKLILPGDIVTAVGLWDPTRGIVPKMGRRKVMVQLRPGGGEAMVAQSTQRPWGMLAFSVVWAGATHAFIYFALRSF